MCIHFKMLSFGSKGEMLEPFLPKMGPGKAILLGRFNVSLCGFMHGFHMHICESMVLSEKSLIVGRTHGKPIVNIEIWGQF